MFESFQEALTLWEDQGGGTSEVEMRSEAWKAVRSLADEISMERSGAPLRMHAIRWGCTLAAILEERFVASSFAEVRTL